MSGEYELYPWQKELLVKIASDMAAGNALVVGARQCGKSEMWKAMTEAKRAFVELEQGAANVPARPYYRCGRDGKPSRY